MNLRQLTLRFDTPLNRFQPNGETNLSLLLESLHCMTELQRLELIRINPKWIKRLAQNMPSNLKELRLGSKCTSCPPDVLDELLFALPPGLQLFDTKLDLEKRTALFGVD